MIRIVLTGLAMAALAVAQQTEAQQRDAAHGYHLASPDSASVNDREVEIWRHVYIAPMTEDLDGFIAAEFMKQHVRAIVVSNEKDADYILTGGAHKGADHWYYKMLAGGSAGTARLIDAKKKTLVWSADVTDRDLLHRSYLPGGTRQVAAGLVRQLIRDSVF